MDSTFIDFSQLYFTPLIFGKNIHEMLLKGLNDYLDSNCIYLTRGDI